MNSRRNGENCESRLYVGNLDQRITESTVIKMFSSFGTIISVNFLWHTRGPKRGEPRGYVFIEFSTKEEAEKAKLKMNGKLVGERPMIVRFASEKYLAESENNVKSEAKKLTNGCSRSAKIAAIKNKLKSLDEESCSLKKSG